ncbi:phenylacetic acid degradation protein [Streptomyces sulfonofaciens]|uniref:Phenylacetic acid degradation protein n=1 Tax=Streptomyces sulfonofaciens TaxID=68272 RepID=A0A919GJH4_9ACTN|nr:PaaI family thioesterase [Streptomyces sulfonofaciens]GHH85714.1 phenylacetic acid degradation protein [Streptomyces sulfonofaciens]
MAISDASGSDAARERTYRWQDPATTAAAVPGRSGREFLEAIGDGTLPRPPILDTLGIDVVEVGDGRVVFALTPAEWHYNPIGSVHGGVMATLADTALGCAVHSRLPAGTGYTSLEVKINFTRAVTLASGRLVCEGKVLTLGRRTATSEARILDQQDRLVAHASTTCLVFPV